MRKQFNLQLFAAPTGTTVTADLEPGISIDYTSRISSNINELQDLANKNDVSFNYLVCQMLQYCLDNLDDEKKDNAS